MLEEKLLITMSKVFLSFVLLTELNASSFTFQEN